MLNIDLNIVPEYNGVSFNQGHIRLIHATAGALKQAINSEAFKQEVLGFSFKPRLGKPRYNFNYNKGLSRKEIYSLIMSGNDRFVDQFPNDPNQLNDKDIDIWIHPYIEHSNTVGYTNGKTYATWINLIILDKWIDNYGSTRNKLLGIMARNMMHEYCHNLGFDHKGNRPTYFNSGTVPYAIGDILNNIIAGQFINSEEEIDDMMLDMLAMEPECHCRQHEELIA